ncbi:hypothetical protein PEC18_00100 [Paucibacter sp. O1-1]|nr:hypothetical protein [Paucibacter sp. O1-1]MDA3824331.1 hypothetical protein [Paucibacter sp. O1-1]
MGLYYFLYQRVGWRFDGAVGIAKFYGLSDLVIGLTIIAVGTSLPELAACIAGVLKKEDDLAIGNIVGSNLFNILAVLGYTCIDCPRRNRCTSQR